MIVKPASMVNRGIDAELMGSSFLIDLVGDYYGRGCDW